VIYADYAVGEANPTLDPKCPPGTMPGFESNVWQFTGAPAERFMDKMGSFFHSEWYTGTIDSTNGTDNTPGATRGSHFQGAFFIDRLTAYSRTPYSLLQQFTSGNKGPVSSNGSTLASYTEELHVTSICGGTAAYVSMTAGYCVNEVVMTYAGYDRLRRESVGKVAEEVGGVYFEGTCPLSVE